MSLGEAAVWYAQNGYWILPLKPREKKPLINWKQLQERPLTKEEVEKYWKEKPDANIGLITGHKSGLVVFDFDSEDAWDWYLEKFKVMDTPICLTNRLFHHYFQLGKEFSSCKLKEGIEIKANGSYVVAPPSIHPSGKKYQWKEGQGIQDVELSSFPKAIRKFLASEKNKGVENITPKKDFKTLLAGVEEGERNNAAARLIGSELGKGKNPDDVWDFIHNWNSKNRPPLPEYELKHVWSSIVQRESMKNPPATEHRMNHALSFDTGNHDGRIQLIDAKTLCSQKSYKPRWIWEGILPEGGTSLLVAKPKVGKSTLALNLAGAVARGVSFLERDTKQSSVIYLALEEKREEIQYRLKVLDLDDAPIFFHFGSVSDEAFDELEALLVKKRCEIRNRGHPPEVPQN